MCFRLVQWTSQEYVLSMKLAISDSISNIPNNILIFFFDSSTILELNKARSLLYLIINKHKCSCSIHIWVLERSCSFLYYLLKIFLSPQHCFFWSYLRFLLFLYIIPVFTEMVAVRPLQIKLHVLSSLDVIYINL